MIIDILLGIIDAIHMSAEVKNIRMYDDKAQEITFVTKDGITRRISIITLP